MIIGSSTMFDMYERDKTNDSWVKSESLGPYVDLKAAEHDFGMDVVERVTDDVFVIVDKYPGTPDDIYILIRRHEVY